MNASLETILYHLIESTLWSFLFVACVHFLKIEDSKLRCWIYRIALLKFLFPSVWLVTLLHLNPQDELVPLMIIFSEPIDTFASLEMSTRSVSYMFYLWSAVIAVIVVRTAVLIVRFILQLKSVSKSFGGRDQSLLEAALVSMGKPLDTLPGYAAETKLPIGLLGIFRPRIIAKHEFLEMLNDRELTAAFQHEIAHKERWDNFWRLLIDGITCIFWFHPIVWYLKRKILIETEKACDERVLLAGQSTNTYANCLLKAAEYAHSGSHFCSVGLSETSIKTRVSNVIHYEKGKKTIMKTIGIVLTACALLTGSFTLLASTDAPIEKSEIYQIGDLDVKPRPTKQVAPKYPEELKEQKINGMVHVKFIVDEEGDVSDIVVVDPQPTHAAFIAPTVEALLQWKFSPGLVDGEPVRVRVRAPMVFRIEGGSKADSEAVWAGYLERIAKASEGSHEMRKIYEFAKLKTDTLRKLDVDEAEMEMRILQEMVVKMVREERFIDPSEF